LFLQFEEIMKDIYGRWDAQVPTQNLKGPDEALAVGV